MSYSGADAFSNKRVRESCIEDVSEWTVFGKLVEEEWRLGVKSVFDLGMAEPDKIFETYMQQLSSFDGLNIEEDRDGCGVAVERGSYVDKVPSVDQPLCCRSKVIRFER